MTLTAQPIEIEALASAKTSGAPILESINPLHDVKVTLQVRIGELQTTLGQLMSLKENEILELDTPVGHPIDLLLNGKVIARGTLMAVDGRFAVRVTEIPTPIKL